MTILSQLRVFATLAEELHFGRAAQRLNMTQPPLSLTIKELEAQWKAPLFHRTKRSVALTDFGVYLLPQVSDLLASAERLDKSAHAAARGEAGTLSLAFVSIVDYSFLPGLLRKFTAKYPGVRVHLREATTDVQFSLLGAQQVDVGIVLGDADDTLQASAPLRYERLRSESLVLALPSSHKLARSTGPIALSDCAKDSFIMIPRHIAPRLHNAMHVSCVNAGFTPRVVQEAIQMQTIISLVSAKMGVALVPESITSLSRTGVSYRPLKKSSKNVPTSPLDIGLVWRVNDESAVLHRFLEVALDQRRSNTNRLLTRARCHN